MDRAYQLDNTRILIATMHKKEHAIMPICEKYYT